MQKTDNGYSEKTKNYYKALNNDNLCSCDLCRNYYQEIKRTYPELSDHLAEMGIDIEKPFETIPLDPIDGTIEYLSAQYIVMGNASDFKSTDVSGVHIGIADSHPATDMDAEHFVIEIWPIKLKWTI